MSSNENENTVSTGNYYVNMIQKKFIEQSALIFNKNQGFAPAEAAVASVFVGLLTYTFFKRLRSGFAFGMGLYIGYNFDYYHFKALELAKRYKLRE